MKLIKFTLTIIVFTFCLFLLGPLPASAQSQRDIVIQAARAYETAPSSKETAKIREKALRWVIETDEIHLVACGGVFSMFSDKKNKNSSDMTAAYMLGMAAFKLENSSKGSDEDAVQLAGIESALKTYEVLVKEKPKTKNDGIEGLLVKRNDGELAGMVAAAACGKK